MTTFCIQHGEVVLPDRSIPDGTVVIEDGRIVYAGESAKTPSNAAEIDGRDSYVTPGLIDQHIHGAGQVGWEACSAEGLKQFESTLLAHGVLRFVPTMMADESVIRRVVGLLEAASFWHRAPGIYVEGPFISPEKRGGVQPPYVRSVNLAHLRKLQKVARGRIRMMTFAPELEGADRLPAAMRTLGILPCVGHSAATAAQVAAVCGRRKICCTHLYNAMSGLDHRRPGVAAFGLNRRQVYVELNPDGTHVAPDLLRITHRAKQVDRIVLISDAVVSAGGKPGIYDYMNKKVRSSTRGVYYDDEGTLVGSSILLNEGVRRFMHSTGAPIHEAVRMASLNPANLLGLGRYTGSLEPGKSADLVLFSRDFRKVHAVFWRGKPVILAT